MRDEPVEVVDHPFTDYPLLSSEKIWEGAVFGLREDRLLLPGVTQPVTRQYLDHPGAVAIAALRGDSQILLLEQYRHPVRAKLWELPAGLMDQPGDAPLAAAKRELREEADLEGGQWSVLVDFLTTPGGSDEALRVFLVQDPTDCGEPFARFEEEAELRAVWVDLDEAASRVLRGELHNPTAVVGILATIESKRRGWADLRPSEAPWTLR